MNESDLNPLSSLNNHNQPPSKAERPRMEPIVDKPARLQQRSWWRRAGDALFADDSKTIGDYIVKDVVLPTVRDMIYEMVSGGLSMALYSTPNRGSRRNSNSSGYRSYDAYYNQTKPKEAPRADRYRTNFDVTNVVVPDQNIGYEALDKLSDRMQTYGAATVQDLYDILNIGSAPHTMVRYGWTDISRAVVQLERGEWILKMPKPVPVS